MLKRYATVFQKNPHLHCETLSRTVLGNKIIDHEKVTGFTDGRVLESVAIYEIQQGLIRKVYFVSK
jgi:hypothetical protein